MGKQEELNNACKNGELEKIKNLINSGAKVNPDWFAVSTPLEMSVFAQTTEVMELLLEKGAGVNTRDDVLGRTALHLAASDLKIEHMRVLLKNGANTLMTDNSGRTPQDMLRVSLLPIVLLSQYLISIKKILQKRRKC